MRSYCPVFIKSQTDKMGTAGIVPVLPVPVADVSVLVEDLVEHDVNGIFVSLSVTADDKMPVIFFHLIIY